MNNSEIGFAFNIQLIIRVCRCSLVVEYLPNLYKVLGLILISTLHNIYHEVHGETWLFVPTLMALRLLIQDYFYDFWSLLGLYNKLQAIWAIKENLVTGTMTVKMLIIWRLKVMEKIYLHKRIRERSNYETSNIFGRRRNVQWISNNSYKTRKTSEEVISIIFLVPKFQ